MVTYILIVLNLLTGSVSTIQTDEAGKQQIENSKSDYVIIDDIIAS